MRSRAMTRAVKARVIARCSMHRVLFNNPESFLF